MLFGIADAPGFPLPSASLEAFGLKFTCGGAHISRTMMLAELATVLAQVPLDAPASEYRSAILHDNVLGKTTDSTRQKSHRHLRELYALDRTTPIFGLLRKLNAVDRGASLPLLAAQVAWARDPLFRATTQAILVASVGDRVETVSLSQNLQDKYPDQYSEHNLMKIARNAASSWTQAGYLKGAAKKICRPLEPTAVAATMAFFLGHIGGYRGALIFSNPWCTLLRLDANRSRTLGYSANRAGLLNLRAISDIVEVSFPLFAEFQSHTT